jgi:P-type Cu+ transporter
MDNRTKLIITNMRCAGCVKTIEAALNNHPRVEQATVNFADKTVTIQGVVKESELLQAIKKAGYDAKPFKEMNEEQVEFIRFRHLMRKFILAGIFRLLQHNP